MAKTVSVPVYCEAGRSRTFACAIDWPGWSRRAKTPDAALATLAEYVPRYALVADRAGVRFPPADAQPVFTVVETIPAVQEGFSYPDFGAIGQPYSGDAQALSAAQAKRLAALVEGSWAEFDAVVATAPAALRKGPRGGGRDRDKIVEHVLGAEAAYARKLGVRVRAPAPGDAAAIEALRAAIADVLRSARAWSADDSEWAPRFAARRIAWHVLDHAWEIEDRSTP